MLARTEFAIPANDDGTAATVAAMCDLMRAGAQTPEVQAIAAMIAASIPRDADPAEWPYRVIGAIREFVASRWEFRDDPHPVELLYGAEAQSRLLEASGAGVALARGLPLAPIEYGTMRADCDDAAILFGAIGLALGFDAAVVCVAFLTNDAPYSHTWSQLRPRTGNSVWIEGDVTRTMQAIPMDHVSRCSFTPVQPVTGGGSDVHPT